MEREILRGFSLGGSVERLLIAVALFKIQRFLRDGLRLRTACDLELDGDSDALVVTRPQGFVPPTLAEIEAELPKLIKEAASVFSTPARTIVNFQE
jgi:CRISPR-associated protein Csb1